MTIASLCFMVAGLLLCTPIAGLAVFAAASLENALHLERQLWRMLPWPMHRRRRRAWIVL